MLRDMVTTIVISIRDSGLCKTPYPGGMSTSVSWQGLRSQIRILYDIRLNYPFPFKNTKIECK